MSTKYCLFAALAVIAIACPATVAQETPSKADESIESSMNRPEFAELAEQAIPILKKHCFACHNQAKPSGDLRLDVLSVDLAGDPVTAEKWQAVLEMVRSGEMPPKDARRLRVGKRQRLTQSIQRSLDVAVQIHGAGSQGAVPRRLNRTEYANTMHDLFGLDMDYTRDLPSDPASQAGFRNDGQTLQMSAEHLATYLETARRALDRAIVFGPAPPVYRYEFSESNVRNWKGKVEFSNRLGRAQEFIVKMVDDYPEQGEFLIRVRLSAELKPSKGFPILEVALGYRPDTEILFREVAVKEITQEAEQVLEFRGRVEEFPLPVRGQGKFPGLVVKLRNSYDDGSPLPKGEQEKEKDKRWIYADQPHLPKLIIHGVEFQSPESYFWPPEQHRRLLPDSPLRNTDETLYARQVLEGFLPLAYRRPVQPSEIDSQLEFFKSVRPTFSNFEEAIRETLAMALIRPEFLYLMPSRSGAQGVESVGKDWRLASQLSYFLWSTMPDEELRRLAGSGELQQPRVLSKQVDRMLAHPNASRLVEQFTGQWLQLEKLEHIAVNRQRYPQFDDRLKHDMRRETHSFFKELLDHDLSALNLIQSDFAVLNETMARHYGIEGVWGDEFRRVAVEPSQHRGGVLAQASILLGNSTGGDSHPVRRAVWVRDRLLNDPPAPPPADVPPLNEADPKFLQMTVRQQLEVHRNTESCAQCHRYLDPWGIALENFDALGLWRSGGEKPVDAVASFSDGRQIDGAEALKSYIVEERRDQFVRSLVTRMTTYAFGRKLAFGDGPMIARLTDRFAAADYRLKSLIHGIAAEMAEADQPGDPNH